MAERTNPPRIDLPRGWPRRVRSAMLHTIALAQYAITYPRSWAIDCRIARLRLKAENDQLRQEVTLLTEEIRRKLPPLYAQDGKGGKAVVYTKYFMPSSDWTWYASEGEPVTDDSDSGREVDFRFFGLVDGHCKELGYFVLSELEEVQGPMGLPIERDLYWKPKTLEEIAPELFNDDEESD